MGEADYNSSFDFLREFDNDFNKSTVSNRRTQLYITKSWRGFHLSARASRFETYFQAINQSVLTTYFPQVSFNSFRRKFFGPLYFSFSSSFSRWKYGYDTQFELGTATRLQTLSFQPVLSLPFSSIPWLTVNAAVALNLNYYWQTYVPDPENSNRRIIADEPLFNRNFVLSFDVLGPVLFRVFMDKTGAAKVKHIIEPTVSYRYDSPTVGAEKIVTARGFFIRYHQVVYGLANHVLFRENNMARERLTFGLAQVFYLLPEESPLSPYRFEGRIPRYSDISSYLRFFPAVKFSLDVSANFNPYHKTFSTLRLGANFGSPLDDANFSVIWFKSVTVWYQDAWWNREQINVSGRFNLPRLRIQAQAEVNFNVLERTLQHMTLQLLYDYQCLIIRGGLMYFQIRREIVPIIQVTLGGIGSSEGFLNNPRL
ncbi:MAG: LPS-assembly protein LptD [Candidatus Aminicenantes bacterium]|nr:LPS-assembly protein LptD [Candidatus Aminicenantes bacterium]